MSKIFLGKPWPLGSSITPRGVNFSVAAPNAEKVHLLIFEGIKESNIHKTYELNKKNRSGDYWHIEIEGLKEGCCYAYRVFTAYNANETLTTDSKILLDPCARAISGWDTYERDSKKGAISDPGKCLRGIVTERESFDFISHPRPRHLSSQSVIYELHVGGFTKHSNSEVWPNHKGTFLGLINKIEYLKSLNVTAIELLPVFAFDPNDAPIGRVNYWGYSPINWFTPHHNYIAGKDPLEARKQFRKLVAKCHDNGIEVIIDVVYNHTTEGGKNGPTISWRGFDDNTYYHKDNENNYLDVSGCGNSIAANRPLVSQLILESMRCWAIELGVDGFRFDLGIALSRGENLEPLDKPPLFEAIDADPLLSDLKLISEPWDCGGLYRLRDFPAKRISTWNGHFRDNIRRFWKGDKNTTWALKEHLSGGSDLYEEDNNPITKSINFITSHDGFTLNDLVSFNTKHNLANGENNRDGDNHNNSWNHGIEGPTNDINLITTRKKQQRNLLATLLLSPGIPMLLMGDEVSRSQGGNNNTWCQDNPLGWMLWGEKNVDINMLDFVKNLLTIRQNFPEIFSPYFPHQEHKRTEEGLWLQWHGIKKCKPDWGSWSHTISYSINKETKGAVMWMGLNAYTKKMIFELPEFASPLHCILNTKDAKPKDMNIPSTQWEKEEIEVESKSMVVMLAQEYINKIIV